MPPLVPRSTINLPPSSLIALTDRFSQLLTAYHRGITEVLRRVRTRNTRCSTRPAGAPTRGRSRIGTVPSSAASSWRPCNGRRTSGQAVVAVAMSIEVGGTAVIENCAISDISEKGSTGRRRGEPSRLVYEMVDLGRGSGAGESALKSVVALALGAAGRRPFLELARALERTAVRTPAQRVERVVLELGRKELEHLLPGDLVRPNQDGAVLFFQLGHCSTGQGVRLEDIRSSKHRRSGPQRARSFSTDGGCKN